MRCTAESTTVDSLLALNPIKKNCMQSTDHKVSPFPFMHVKVLNRSTRDLYYIARSTPHNPMLNNASFDGCKCEQPPVAATIETLAEPDGPLPKPFMPPLMYPPIPVVAFPITTGLPEGGYDKITPFVVITSPGVSVSTGDPSFSITTAPPFGPYDATIPCVVNTSPGVRTSAGVGF
jgi:hypothetical protein